MRGDRIARIGALVCALGAPAFAHATLTVTPVTWNVIGLDSNSPAAGPKHFPVGARVCSNVATTAISVDWLWDSANANVNLRPGSLATITIPSLAAGTCADAYFEVEINQVPAAYDTTRRYHIAATDGSGTASTPVPRELYVEHLISQSRNAITGVKLDGTSIPAGGSLTLVVGNTYAIELDGGTATQGYNQFEAFVNFPNTIFQILSVSTTYSADNSPYVPGPAPIASDKLYADACLWQNDPASPNYLSCIGGDYKAGGSDVRTTYTVKIIGGGGTSQTLSGLLYDFSGSSFHYNADFSVNTWIADIVDPSAVTIAKAFAPTPTVAGGTSTLTFTLANPNAGVVSGANFVDPLPLLSGSQMVVATPATYSTSGCGAPTFAPISGASSISFANGTIAANSSCIVSVRVSVPAIPTAGTYTNISNDLFIGAIDTGHNATASLGLTTSAPPTNLCGLTLAQWTMPPAAGVGVPPAYSFKATDVSAATAAAGSGITSSINTTFGNPVNSWNANGFATTEALTTTNNDYFEFAATTTNYTSIGFKFDARLDTNLHGPRVLQLYSSTDGSTFTPYGSTINPTSAFVTYNPAFSGTANTGGLTYFRIYGYNAGNNGADALLFLDNVTITGCQTPQPPTLTKTFLANPVAVGGTSTLRFTLTNQNTAALTRAKFSDSLPAGLQVAAIPAASTTCTGSPSWSPAAGATTLDFGQTTGAAIPASSSCTVSVDVTATTAGPHTNVSGFISSTESGTNAGTNGSAVASLTAILPPAIAKSFAPNPILANGASLLTFTITNPNPDDPLAGIAFADTYPGGLVNVSPLSPPVANTCGGSVTASAGGNTVSLAGGSLAADATCTVSVTVTAAAAGDYVNASGPVSANIAGSGNTASDALTVAAPHPAIGLLKQIATSATGPWYKFVTVAPGTPLFYLFTVENIGDVTLATFSVSDPALAGSGADPAGCVWQTINVPSTLPTLPVGTPTIDPSATCVVGPIAAASGSHSNTATAQGIYNATPYPSLPSTADYLGATPGFSLLKEIGTSPGGPWSAAINVASGGSVYYKFTLVNTGGLDLTSISVTDPLVSTASCTFTDPLVVGNATICIVGPVMATGAGGSTTTNTAVGHGSNGGTTYDTSPSSASYTISSTSADLAITKTDGVASVNAGGSTTYTITVTNNGPSEVTNATVVDTAPPALTFGNWTCAVGNPGSGGTVATACGAASGSGNLNTTVTMKSGAIVTFTVPATVAGAATGSIVNTATVTVPAGITDPNATNDSATDTDAVTPVADLAITKTDGVASVNAGASTTYTITVTNNGPSGVTGAILADPAASGLSKTAVACSSTPGQCISPPGIAQLEGGSFALPALANGATYEITVTADVAASSGSVSNSATVTAPAGTTDPNLANNSATDTDTVTAMADLAITKSDGVASVSPGGSTAYTITVTNNGPSEVAGAAVVDTAPPGLAFGAWTCVVSNAGSGGTVTTACGVPSGSGNINTTVTMKSGASITFTVPATVAGGASGSIANTATVTAPAGTTDPNPGNDSATDTDTVVVAPVNADLAITKSDGVASVSPGGSTSYTITVTNNGPSEVSGATVIDTAPAALTFGTWTCAVSNPGIGGTVTTACGAASGSGNLNTTVAMKNGAVITFTVPATVSVSASGSITNTATVTVPAGTTDPNAGNDSATDTDTVVVAPVNADLAITKTDGVASVTAGAGTSYTITVTNNGPSEVTNATVVDTAPAGLTFGTWTCVVTNPGGGGTVTTACGAASGSGNLNTTVTMKNGAVITFTVPAAVAVSATGSIVNTATVGAPAGTTDPNPGNNSASDADTVVAAPVMADLAVTKTSGASGVSAGGSTTYTITVTNNGPGEVTGATVTDIAPVGLAFGTWTCLVSNPGSGGAVTTACGAASGTGNINTTVTMKVGAVIVYTVPATVSGSATGSIINTVSVNTPAGTTDPTPTNNSAASAITISGGSVVVVPLLHPWALAALAMLLGLLAMRSIATTKRPARRQT